MPCYMTGTREGDLALRVEELHEEATKTTRLLCKTLRSLDKRTVGSLPKDVQEWWEKHQEIDRKRK